jgi:hypothetical protein
LDEESKSSGKETSSSMRILEMIDSGRISAEDGLRLLQALSGSDGVEETSPEAGEVAIPLEPPAPEPAVPEELAPLAYNPAPASTGTELPLPQEPLPVEQVIEPAAAPYPRAESSPTSSPATPPPDVRKWSRWWLVPLWVGLAISIFGGIFMTLALRANPGFSFWLLCAIVPFALGILVMILAWLSRNAPWLHLRVQQAPGEKPQRINISMPLPLGIIAWVFRHFGHYMKGMENFPVEDMIMAVSQSTSAENPLYIQVDEGEDGEKVEIFIG